jgi:hypothetical protein
MGMLKRRFTLSALALFAGLAMAAPLSAQADDKEAMHKARMEKNAMEKEEGWHAKEMKKQEKIRRKEMKDRAQMEKKASAEKAAMAKHGDMQHRDEIKQESEMNREAGMVHEGEMDHGAMGVHGAISGVSGHKAGGTVALEGNTIKLSDDFWVDKVPDAYLVLASGDQPDAQSVWVTKLNTLNGAQEYALPAGTEAGRYSRVLLWCKQYGVLIGSAALAEGAMMR